MKLKTLLYLTICLPTAIMAQGQDLKLFIFLILIIFGRLELEYTNDEKVTDFLKWSLYYNQTINKQELLSVFEKLKPVVISLSPNINGQIDVDSSLTEVTINFSEPMSKRYSINYGDGGEEHFPITGVIGYAKDYK